MHIKVGDRHVGIEATGNGEDVVYISHAHTDHIVRTEKDILSSHETFRLIQNRKLKHREKFDGVEMFPSGHMLGATQIRIGADKTIVYTGDLKLRDGFTTSGAPVLECDELYIDTTYGDPSFLFPSKEKVAEEIVGWLDAVTRSDSCAVIGAYRLGKAQELVGLLNACGITPIVEKSIEKGCEIYEEFGVGLKRTCIDSMDGGGLENSVMVVPFHRVEDALPELNGRVQRAVVTGWCQKFNYAIKAFPLSDHADFSEILRYAAESRAKKIICKFGSHPIVTELRKRGFNAKLG